MEVDQKSVDSAKFKVDESKAGTNNQSVRLLDSSLDLLSFLRGSSW